MFGPTFTLSLGGNKYGLVIVDDFFRFTWVFFLRHKSEAFRVFEKFSKQVQNEKGLSIVSLRTDHDKEFENESFMNFCEQHEIKHNFSAPYTRQQYGVAERKNRVIQEIARSLLNESGVT